MMISERAYPSMCASNSPVARLLVVDDHGIVRDGLTALLEREEGMTVVGQAATGEEAILAAQRLRPDVIIMDLVLPDLNGIDATRRILSELPLTRIIVLSAYNTDEHVYRALRAGACGYVVKAAASADLALAVKVVTAGNRYVSPGLIVGFVDEPLITSMPKSAFEGLSIREREVLRQVVAGSSSSDIARHLSLSTKTIDTYRGRLMVKLGVRNRSALIRFAIENELLSV